MAQEKDVELEGVFSLLESASVLTITAFVVANRQRQAFPVIEGDEINRVQVRALDHAVTEAREAAVRVQLAVYEVGAIPPALLQGQRRRS